MSGVPAKELATHDGGVYNLGAWTQTMGPSQPEQAQQGNPRT
jgi:hypothetical protein